MYQINILYILNLHSDTSQLYVNKKTHRMSSENIRWMNAYWNQGFREIKSSFSSQSWRLMIRTNCKGAKVFSHTPFRLVFHSIPLTASIVSDTWNGARDPTGGGSHVSLVLRCMWRLMLISLTPLPYGQVTWNSCQILGNKVLWQKYMNHFFLLSWTTRKSQNCSNN